MILRCCIIASQANKSDSNTTLLHLQSIANDVIFWPAHKIVIFNSILSFKFEKQEN